MIVVDDRAPRWIRELARFQPVKNLLFLYGNVLDLVTFLDEQDGKATSIGGYTLDRFLERFLLDRGYEVVGLLDPLGSLTFPNPQMKARYEQLATGRQAEPAGAAAPEAPRGPAQASTRTQTGREPAGGHPCATAVSGMARAMANETAPCAFVAQLASRLIASPGQLSEPENEVLTRVLQASLGGKTAMRRDSAQQWNNLLILVCDKLNDLPAYLYVDNPRARAIHVDKPDRAERQRFLAENYSVFYGAAPGAEPSREVQEQFGFLTDGMASYELHSLLKLSRAERLEVGALESLVSRYKYGVTRSEWDSPELRARLQRAPEIVRERVQGQDVAVARVLDLVKRAALGLAAGVAGKSHRPRGVLFFAGPTGVGKTEMAKALAEILFGSEDRLERFDMSEYGAEHADQRLLGAPPGYIGYEEGGQLTNRVKEHPFSVLLFDEIDKAHSRIFDKFLQILDDGRLTDGKGDTVYFSESVIIFTSNLGTAELAQDRESSAAESGDGDTAGPVPPPEEVRETILGAITRFFTRDLRRPEILNRFGDNFVVFDYIRPPLHEAILDLLIKRLQQALLKERRITLTVADQAKERLAQLALASLHLGGRGIRNVIDRALIDPLARWLFEHAQDSGALTVASVTDRGLDAAYRFELEVRSTSHPEGRA